MRAWLAGILILVLSSFTGSGICAEREVIYAFDEEFPPFSYFENGSAAGFDIEIFQAILHDKKFQLTLQPMNWENVQDELTNGTVHLTSGMAMTDERKELYEFTDVPLSNLNVRLFVREQDGVKSIDDLKGKRIATQSGSLYHRILEEIEGLDLALYDTETEALQALADDSVQAFGGSEQTACYHIRKKGYKGIRAVGTPLKVTRTYFVARKGDGELVKAINTGMREIIANGVYDKIYRKWFVDDPTGDEIESLINKAREASTHAYAPYSKFQVGAAALTRSGMIYTGCNVENALYNLTTTALKVAVFKAVSEGDSDIKAVVNVLPDGALTAPAADDRQLLYEFGRGILVIMDSGEESRRTVMVSELLPYAFDMR